MAKVTDGFFWLIFHLPHILALVAISSGLVLLFTNRIVGGAILVGVGLVGFNIAIYKNREEY
jgi:hypothetical protein